MRHWDFGTLRFRITKIAVVPHIFIHFIYHMVSTCPRAHVRIVQLPMQNLTVQVGGQVAATHSEPWRTL